MNSLKDKNDGILVEMSLLGDQTAYEELVIRHEKSVKGTAYKVTENEFSAEDASQDAFVSAWIKLDSLREKDKFGSWVCSIAKNCARDLVVHYMSASGNISLNLLENTELVSSDESGLADILNIVNISEQERDQKLHEAVEALSEKIRETVKLHYFEGLSVAEIAEQQNLPTGTVKWRLNEGRRQLRKEYGVMENNENATFVQKVMYQVEQLKLWSLKNNKTGFEADYRKVLQNIEKLEDSTEKQHALADVLLRGYWWLTGGANDKVLAKIKQSAEQSRNEEVIQMVIWEELKKFSLGEKIDFMINTQLPYLQKHGFKKIIGYLWFWIGEFYCWSNQFEKGIETYKKVFDYLNETDAYYSIADASIYLQQKRQQSKKNTYILCLNAVCNICKYIEGKLYLWEQPGSSTGDTHYDSIFWNSSFCDSMILDTSLEEGKTITSSDQKITLTCKSKNVTVDTISGEYENCSHYILQGNYCGITKVETYFADGIGVVKQKTTGRIGEEEWQLLKYQINGGNGMLPLAKGNRWEYACVSDSDVIYNVENCFEVVNYVGDTAAIKNYSFIEPLGYNETTWNGNILKARREYVVGNCERLNDVRDALEIAEKLAATKRQKVHTLIAKNVMCRILETEPTINPDYTQRGRWNFFGMNEIEMKNNSIILRERNHTYAFEWKEMDCKAGEEGYKVLYSFLDTILQEHAGAMWSDDWKVGYHHEKDSMVYNEKFKIIFDVLDEEPIKTNLGIFEGCRHIRLNVTGRHKGHDYMCGYHNYWFAQNVGIIKFTSGRTIDTPDAVWELTEYNGTGDGYFPVADGFFRRYEPTDLGDGWHASVEYTFDEDEKGIVMFRNALGTQDRVNYEAEIAKSKQ